MQQAKILTNTSMLMNQNRDDNIYDRATFPQGALRKNSCKDISTKSKIPSEKTLKSFHTMLLAGPNRRTIKTNCNIATNWENNTIEIDCLSSYASEPVTTPIIEYPFKRIRESCSIKTEESTNILVVPCQAITTSTTTQNETTSMMTTTVQKKEDLSYYRGR